ncbi:MAG TPA: hypothetical protein VGF15_00600 [Solirubrobacteraceae bacterium]|jgi:hypothetical protein
MSAAIGGIVLAVAVFLPWYAISVTARGIAFAQQVSAQVLSQYGNAQLQSYLGGLHADLSSLAGHQLATLSAHQVLKNINVVLLIVAAVVILLALAGLAREDRAQSDGERALITALGLIASACVAYRMINPPTPAFGMFSLSLRAGSWLSLAGSLAIVAGGLWPGQGAGFHTRSRGSSENAFAELSGWTPSR